MYLLVVNKFLSLSLSEINMDDDHDDYGHNKKTDHRQLNPAHGTMCEHTKHYVIP